MLKTDFKFVWGPCQWLTPHEMANGTVFTYDGARRHPRATRLKLWPVAPGGLLQVKFTHCMHPGNLPTKLACWPVLE